MNQQEITSLLHHRPPYLMLSKVLEVSEKEILVLKQHDGTEAHYSGHFPESPVVPGAMLQEVCTQAAGVLLTKFYSPVPNYQSTKNLGYALGVLKKVNYAKFLGAVNPKEDIIAKVELVDFIGDLYKFTGIVYQFDNAKAHFSFNLVNIKEEQFFN